MMEKHDRHIMCAEDKKCDRGKHDRRGLLERFSDAIRGELGENTGMTTGRWTMLKIELKCWTLGVTSGVKLTCFRREGRCGRQGDLYIGYQVYLGSDLPLCQRLVPLATLGFLPAIL